MKPLTPGLDRRLGVLIALAGSLLFLAAIFAPWWVATAGLPGGTAHVQIYLYSFRFESPAYGCTTVLVLYPYGNCPLLGYGAGVASLAFYLFWSLVFLVLAAAAGLAWTASEWSGHRDQVPWLPLVPPVLGAFSSLSFIAAITTAGLKFVGWNPLYGSSAVLTWAVSAGFFLAVASTLLLLVGALSVRRGT